MGTPSVNLAQEIGTLKQDIARAVSLAVSQFHRSTGLTPSGIDIHMVDVTHIGEPVRTYIVGDVTVDLGKQ